MLRTVFLVAALAAAGIAERAPDVAHAHPGTRVVVGIVFAVPFLAVAAVMQYRKREKKQAAQPTRPSYQFSMAPPAPRRRRG